MAKELSERAYISITTKVDSTPYWFGTLFKITNAIINIDYTQNAKINIDYDYTDGTFTINKSALFSIQLVIIFNPCQHFGLTKFGVYKHTYNPADPVPLLTTLWEYKTQALRVTGSDSQLGSIPISLCATVIQGEELFFQYSNIDEDGTNHCYDKSYIAAGTTVNIMTI